MIRMLLADDHAIVRKGLIQIILEAYPDAVIGEAGDGRELLAAVEKENWDLVISDISMPHCNGVEALHQIKVLHPDLPVLVVSMHSEDQYAIRVFKAGAAGYLTKDKVHEELVPALQTILKGKKFITPAIAEKLAGFVGKKKQAQSHEMLSDREFEVMKDLAAGKSITEIATRLALSATTVSTYRSRILEKLDLHSNADITRYALEHQLL